MKAKQRILRHLQRYKSINIVTYQGFGLINLHARITELINQGYPIDRSEWIEIKNRHGKVTKRIRKYKLIEDESTN